MKLGYFTFPIHPKNKSLTAAYKEDTSCIYLIDKLGFSEAFIGEHLTDQYEELPQVYYLYLL